MRKFIIMIFDRLIPRAWRPTDSCLVGIIKLNLLFMKEKMSLEGKLFCLFWHKIFISFDVAKRFLLFVHMRILFSRIFSEKVRVVVNKTHYSLISFCSHCTTRWKLNSSDDTLSNFFQCRVYFFFWRRLDSCWQSTVKICKAKWEELRKGNLGCHGFLFN